MAIASHKGHRFLYTIFVRGYFATAPFGYKRIRYVCCLYIHSFKAMDRGLMREGLIWEVFKTQRYREIAIRSRICFACICESFIMPKSRLEKPNNGTVL